MIALAQTTGSFEATVMFMSESRTLACYVPPSYNAANQHQLVVGLHGLGDNAINYRNALINAAGWDNLFTQTIFVCPDGGSDQIKDFYTPAGDEGIIPEAINYITQNYNIDPDAIILQGFSLGGRSALKYGLDNPTDFEGLMLNTPAVQGLADALNDPNAGVIYNYSNASQIPMFITVGSDDWTYEYTLNKIYDTLKKNDAILDYEIISGMQHTLPPGNITTDAITFIDQNSNVNYDMEIFGIDNSPRFCGDNITPVCYVRNLGDQTITSLDIEYIIDGTSYNHTWNGTMNTFQHAPINLPGITVSPGTHNLEVTINTVNGNQTDPDLSNNTEELDFESGPASLSLPYTQNFDGNHDEWTFDQTYNLFEWYEDTDASFSGPAAMVSFNTPLLFYSRDLVESFHSPVLDLSTAITPKLSFQMAFNYVTYEPPTVITPLTFADTFEISVSTDCGMTFESIFRKGGADLATVPNPILDPLNLGASFFTPSQNDWDLVEIDLSQYIGENEVMFKFSSISGMGGTLYLDDIVFGGTFASVDQPNEVEISVYPNPASEIININGLSGSDNIVVNIIDLQGRTVLSNRVNGSNNSIDINNLSPGHYLIQITQDEEESIIKKLTIN